MSTYSGIFILACTFVFPYSQAEDKNCLNPSDLKIGPLCSNRARTGETQNKIALSAERCAILRQNLKARSRCRRLLAALRTASCKRWEWFVLWFGGKYDRISFREEKKTFICRLLSLSEWKLIGQVSLQESFVHDQHAVIAQRREISDEPQSSVFSTWVIRQHVMWASCKTPFFFCSKEKMHLPVFSVESFFCQVSYSPRKVWSIVTRPVTSAAEFHS